MSAEINVSLGIGNLYEQFVNCSSRYSNPIEVAIHSIPSCFQRVDRAARGSVQIEIRLHRKLDYTAWVRVAEDNDQSVI